VALAIRFEIAVAPEVIGEKTQSQFKGDQTNRIEEVAVIGLAQGLPRCFQVATQDGFTAFEVKHHRLRLERFLPQSVATGTQAIANVVMHQPRFNGVEIHQGNGFAGVGIHHQVVHLGIAMDRAQA